METIVDGYFVTGMDVGGDESGSKDWCLCFAVC